MKAPADVRFGTKPPKAKPGKTAPPPRPVKGRVNPYAEIISEPQRLSTLQATFLETVVDIRKPKNSEFPELLVNVPDEWESVFLAPLYDAHIGSAQHDKKLFSEHVQWIQDTPNVLTWNGGDIIENANKLSPGAGVYFQITPQKQIFNAIEQLASIRHKMLFALAGNHEDRIEQLGVDVSEWMAECLEIPYFPGYCACRIHWRGNYFNLLAHHGTGAAQTAGAQLNNIRKELPWAHGFDLYWFGHLHRSMHAKEFRVMHNPKSNRLEQRECYVILSPSYLQYFGGYAEKKRMTPTTRGMAAVELHESGRMDFTEHAAGRRF